MGDSSDNIPGVPGVGPKTARELLLRFGAMAEVYRHLDDPSIRPKLREKLEAGRESAELSYDLATIRCNAPIDFTPQEAMLQEPNKKELYDLFVKLEFVKLIDRYKLREAAPEPEPQQVAVQLPHRAGAAGGGDALRPGPGGGRRRGRGLGRRGMRRAAPGAGGPPGGPPGAGDPQNLP